MKGYLDRPDATKEALRGGWFHFGDSGVRDPEGAFRIVDRMLRKGRREGENG